jgi:hypothetical protein
MPAPSNPRGEECRHWLVVHHQDPRRRLTQTGRGLETPGDVIQAGTCRDVELDPRTQGSEPGIESARLGQTGDGYRTRWGTGSGLGDPWE